MSDSAPDRFDMDQLILIKDAMSQHCDKWVGCGVLQASPVVIVVIQPVIFAIEIRAVVLQLDVILGE